MAKRKPPAPKGRKVALGRWPGAGPKGTRKGMMTKRNKAMKVSLFTIMEERFGLPADPEGTPFKAKK